MMSNVKILGHRGWSANYPENTRLALTQALQLGVDGTEYDVQLSADGVPVILHDPTVDRTTDGTGKVSELTFAQLRAVNAATAKPECGRQTIPSLSEVLDDAFAISPQGFYNIEIKVYNPEWRSLVDRVVAVTSQHPLRERILFSSFEHESLSYLKTNHPTVKVGLLYEDDPQQPWAAAKFYDAYSVNLNYRFATDEVVSRCHAHGVKVAVWTVDEPADILRCLKTGVDVLISNRPDVALRVIREAR